MKRTRYIVAVALVATALCADRVATAAPAGSRPQVVQLANKLVTRLTVSFRRLVPATRVYEDRQAVASAPVRSSEVPTRVVAHHPPLSPFQYRLPPPAC